MIDLPALSQGISLALLVVAIYLYYNDQRLGLHSAFRFSLRDGLSTIKPLYNQDSSLISLV